MTRWFVLFAAWAASLAAQPRVEIIAAYYGLDTHFADVTERVRNQQQTGGVQLTVGAEALAIDPLPGTVKVLRIYSKVNGEFFQGEWKDGELARVGSPSGRLLSSGGMRNTGGMRESRAGAAPAPANPAPPPPGLTLVEARYGSQARTLDVLARLRGLVLNDKLSVAVTNQNMGGDPAVGAAKQLTLVYEWQGQRYQVQTREGRTLSVPGEGSVIGAATVTQAAVPVDGVCLFAEPGYQGASQCWRAGEEQAQFNAGTRFASVRFQGRARVLDLFEAVRFNGRTRRIEGDQPDLNTLTGGGGFFATSNDSAWILTPGSLRVLQP